MPLPSILSWATVTAGSRIELLISAQFHYKLCRLHHWHAWHTAALLTSDQTHATSSVRQLPPMESFRKWVSLLDRYGT